MANDSTLTARLYGEALGDYQLVSSWAQAHGSDVLNESLLPPIGVIIELDGSPACALWCRESYGIGVGIIDNAISRPGLSVADARRSFDFAVTACVNLAKSHAKQSGGDCCHFECYTSKGVARILESLGWQKHGEPLVKLFIQKP